VGARLTNADKEIIDTELQLKDLDSVEKKSVRLSEPPKVVMPRQRKNLPH